MPDSQSPLSRLAASTPVERPDRRKVSVVDTVPGLARDLAAVIAHEMQKDVSQRHSIKTLWELCQQGYPDFRGKMSYNGFWKYVTRKFDYHGSSTKKDS